MVVITKTTPSLFVKFMEVVSSFQPCSLDQIRKGMKEVWGPVYSARNFALEYKFVSFDEKSKNFSLTLDGERYLRFSGNLQVEFLISSFKLQCYEPFASLQKELSQRKTMTLQELADFLSLKFPQKVKWKADKEHGEAVTQWLVFLRVAEAKDDKVTYIKGEVKTAGIIHLPEMDLLSERTLYDFLVESFNTPHNMIEEPYELLKKANEAKDDDEKGQFFELFIGSVFKRFGFSPRLRDGPREQHTLLTFQRKGGGDVGLFFHFPVQTEKEILHGYAIACEGKASESVIGSKAIGQARNLSTKIRELHPKYLIHTMIVSQSVCGYDSSGREQAPPEVVHLNSKTLLSLLAMQEELLEKNHSLLTPFRIMLLFEELLRRQELEPKRETVIDLAKETLRTS
jgi:hypothetical protein